MKYEDVIDYLVATAGDEIRGKGDGDNKVDKLKEAELCEAIDAYICGEEGDEGNDFFKVEVGDVIHLYNGRNYEKIDDIKMRYIIKKVLEKAHVGIVYRRNSAKKIADECKDSLLSNDRCFFEPDRRYVVFNNCVLDTETGKVYEHDIKFKTDVVLDFNYDVGTRSALWDKLIADTIPDTGQRRAFQQFCGAFLVDRRKFKIEYLCMLIGNGRNGKSVVTDAIAGVFGDGLISSYSPEQLFGSSSHCQYNLADINGKIANICDDLKNKDFSGGDFKQFISGHKFQARHIFGRPFVVNRIPLMICCMNEIPPTTDDTLGHYRRLLPILCPNQIADKDVDYELPIKLAAEDVKCAIFNWILDGYKQLVKNSGRIDISDSIKEIREDIKSEANSVRRWIKESGYLPGVNASDWKPMKEWMSLYQEYCKTYSELASTPKKVGRVFKELGFPSEKRRDTTWWCIGTENVSVVRPPKDEDVPNNVLEDTSAFGLANNVSELPF